jgi:hypothetical protein
VRIVRWIGRQRFAAADQISRRFAMDRSRTYRRLRVAIAAGLVDHRRVFHGPGVYLATERGLAATDLALPAAKVDVRTYHHDLALTGLCAAYELAGREIVTEREIRTTDVFAPAPRYAVRLGDQRLHIPDLVAHEPSGLVAIELERTPKRARRLDQIISAYLRARHLAGARYYATDPQLERWLRQAIERNHADQFIQLIGPAPTSKPPKAAMETTV